MNLWSCKEQSFPSFRPISAIVDEVMGQIIKQLIKAVHSAMGFRLECAGPLNNGSSLHEIYSIL